jgi:putative intracellular protease/amidase
MAATIAPFLPEGIAIIKEAAAKKKPIAEQTGSVYILEQAGLLAGKKYALGEGWPKLPDAIYSGGGVVRDGNIITSGVCPYMAKMKGMTDGTPKLTEALIAALKK